MVGNSRLSIRLSLNWFYDKETERKWIHLFPSNQQRLKVNTIEMKIDSKIARLIGLAFLFSINACTELVEEGIEVSYADSNAVVAVEALGGENAAAGETVSFAITVSSDFDIKSCIVKAAVEGRNGSGFNVSDTAFDDPFADHIFGTIREGIQSFKVRYDYIIPDAINKSRISFTIIDESGRASQEKTVEVVPAIAKYEDLELYAKDGTFHDALATIDGNVYSDIKTNYSKLSEANVAVQEKIDIIFYYDKEARRSTLAAPASGRVDLELNIENNTLFRVLNPTEAVTLDNITPSSLAKLVSDASILSDGSSQLTNIKVGDVIGFVTDLNAVHSLKSGILIVKGLHPANVARYAGVSYVLECEVAVQK